MAFGRGCRKRRKMEPPHRSRTGNLRQLRIHSERREEARVASLCTFALWTAAVRLGRIPSCRSRRLSPVDCAVKGHFSRSRRSPNEFPGIAWGVSRLARSAL